jgi:hypothetical protein
MALGLRTACLVWTFLLALPAWAQDAKRPQEPLDTGLVEQAGERLIQLDVSFVPKTRGVDPTVPELGIDDFEVVIGGKRIDLEYADRLCRATREELVEPSTPETALAVVPPRPVQPVATYIFYLEHSHLTMMGQNAALEMAELLIRELIVDGNRGMVVSSGGKLLQSPFSEDPGELLDFIGSIRGNTAQWREFAYAQGEEQRHADISSSVSAALGRALARTYQLEEMRLTENRLRRLGATIGGLAEVDPPKAVLYFADIIRRKPGEHYTARFGGEQPALSESFAVDRVTADANGQGVRLYTIQAQGLQAVRRGGSTEEKRVRDAEDTMVSLAAETGGAMFRGGTDHGTMSKITTRIHQDLSCFYLLSFYPTGLREDQLLPVLVRVTEGSERGEEANRTFDVRARGQIVIQSASKREEALLLAAHAASGTVESDTGRGVIIPLAYEKGRYRALVQFVVETPDLPLGLVFEAHWDLGMTLVQGPEVKDRVSARIQGGDPSLPVVLETVWDFAPDEGEVISVGRESRLGQLAMTQLELDWPDPDKRAATVSPIVVLQQSEGLFLRKQGKVAEDVRRVGTLGVGDNDVATDRPVFLVALVCRGPRAGKDLWVQRRLNGESTVEFELLKWTFEGERCIQLRDLARADQLGWGDFNYEVLVYDNENLEGDPVAEGSRDFTVFDETRFLQSDG